MAIIITPGTPTWQWFRCRSNLFFRVTYTIATLTLGFDNPFIKKTKTLKNKRTKLKLKSQ